MSNMDPGTFDLSTFGENLDRYGIDMDRWPPELRTQAAGLLETSEAARRMYDQAMQLTTLLSQLPEKAAAPGLGSRIVTGVPPQAWSGVVEWFTAALWRPALAAALTLAFGFALGVYQQQPLDEDLADELSLLAFSPAFEEPDYDE